jgi:hypothetical protein
MKRSAQVVLVVMAATGVGATSYAFRPADDCAQRGVESDACNRRGGTGSHGGGSYFFGSRGSSASPSGSSTALGGATVRGGFGGTAHGMGAHGSGT